MMDRCNRILWSCIAVAVLAVGVIGLLAGMDVIRSGSGHTTLLPQQGVRLWQQAGTGALAGLAAVGLALSLGGALLVRAQLASGRPGTAGLEVPSHPDGPPARRGRTAVCGSTIERGFERDLRRIPSVQRARVRMSGSAGRLLIVARIDVVADANIQGLQGDIRNAIDRLTSTNGAPPDAIDVTIRLHGRRVPRVA
jgi:hypothetical protein